MQEHGKSLIIAGIILVAGGLLLSSGYLGWLGKLPGDISIKKDNLSFYFPITTCVVLSAVLSVIFWLLKGK